MSNADFAQTVDQLAESLVLADLTDPSALAQVHTLFQQVESLTGQLGLADFAQTSGRAADLIEALILESVEDADQAVAQINTFVNALQALTQPGIEPEEIPLPSLRLPGEALDAPDLSLTTDAPVQAGEPQTGADSTIAALGSLPVHVDREIFAEFLDTQPAVLDDMEAHLLALERGDLTAMPALKRLVHTLKGEAGLLGLDDVSRLCHVVEDRLDAPPDADLIDFLLRMQAWLGATWSAFAGRGPGAEPVTILLDALQALAAPPEFPALPESRVPQPERAASLDQTEPSILDESPKRDAPSDVSTAGLTADPLGSTIAAVDDANDGDTDLTESASEAASEAASDAALEATHQPLTGDPDLLSDFIQEAREHLETCDVELLKLETDPTNSDGLNGVFRAFHTIKGVAGFVSLTQIQGLAHEAETLLDKARKGSMVLRGPALDATFEAADAMRRLIDLVEAALTGGSDLALDPAIPGLIRAIQAAEGLAAAQADRSDAPDTSPPDPRPLGELIIERGQASSEQVAHALATQTKSPPPKPKLGEVLHAEAKVTAGQIHAALKAQSGRAGDATPGAAPGQATGTRGASPESTGSGRMTPAAPETAGTEPAPSEPAAPDAPARAQAAMAVREMVRVDADRLDQLVDTIGELVIAESMVAQSPTLIEHGGPELHRMLSHLDKITRELQEMAMSLRMMPVRSTFQKMARLARDVAKKIDKKIEFTMAGEDTELDKSIVDQIGDPLVHMIRNAVDHGIEQDSAERVAAGKPAVGQVQLRAFHQGGSIFIEIEDDGRGIDRQVIVAKAIERGLITDDTGMSDSDVFKLLFEPGFSTAKQVTDVSGRGVGMDVVRRNIEALRGEVDIRSTLGRGSVFSIRLPLTLAIIEGMVCRIADQRYIVPTLSIVRMLRPSPEDLSTVFGRGEALRVGEELIPLVRLGDLFGVAGTAQDPTSAMVVIVESGARKVGLLTDELLGQQQIVIKSLGETMKDSSGIAGGAIMPDGLVGLIVDVASLVQIAGVETA